METFANAKWSAAPAYRVGDFVFLDMRNMPTDKPSKKLDDRWAGPFEVKRVWTHHYELALDFELATRHNKFHSNLLRPAPTEWYPGQVQGPAPAIGLDENGEIIWAIDAIIDSRRLPNRGFEYLILWRGYGKDDRSWEPLHGVITATVPTREFHKRYPRKPKPRSNELQRARDFNQRMATSARRLAVAEHTLNSEPETQRTSTLPSATATPAVPSTSPFLPPTTPFKPTRRSKRT
jgi:hypothetical protein